MEHYTPSTSEPFVYYAIRHLDLYNDPAFGVFLSPYVLLFLLTHLLHHLMTIMKNRRLEYILTRFPIISH